MPLKYKPYFEPTIKKIETERQARLLLEDVRDSLVGLDEDLWNVTLRDTLRVVDRGYYSDREKLQGTSPAEIIRRAFMLTGDTEVDETESETDKLDLTLARGLINQYRGETEGGCKSCRNYIERPRTMDGMISISLSGEKTHGKLMYCGLEGRDATAEIFNSFMQLGSKEDYATKRVRKCRGTGCDEKESVSSNRPLSEIL